MPTVNVLSDLLTSASNDLMSILSNLGEVVLKLDSYLDLLYDLMLNSDWLACFLLGDCEW